MKNEDKPERKKSVNRRRSALLRKSKCAVRDGMLYQGDRMLGAKGELRVLINRLAARAKRKK